MLKIRYKAFTLVELLIVIAIIGILATLAIISLQQARSNARDAKRIADVRQTQTALELFFNEYSRYPTEDEWSTGTLVSMDGYMLMQNLPSAPSTIDGECSVNQNDYYYVPSDDYSSYSLSFCLGKNVANLEDGPKCATPAGILDYDCSVDATGDSGGGSEIVNYDICYPSCSHDSVCINGSCVIDTFECGQDLVYQDYTYPTVAIEGQCWMAENLKSTNFTNNDPIPLVLGLPYPWRSLEGPAYSAYQDNVDLQNAYGNLYSYYAILDPRGMCPPGWKIPTESDFLNLFSSIQPRTPLSLNSCLMLNHPSDPACSSSAHPYWNNNASYQGDDYYNFSALPGGQISGGNNSLFSGLNTYAYFATQDTKYFRLYMGPSYTSSDSFMNSGHSVRCIKKYDLGQDKDVPSVTTLAASDISANRATLNASLDSTGALNVYNKGFVWSQDPNPLIGQDNSFLINKYSDTSPFSHVVHDFFPNTTYYFRSYAINDAGLSYGDILSFTTPDPCLGVESVVYQGYTYPTVGIGTQCWFKENLKSTNFTNNDPIPLVLGGSLPWRSLTGPAYTSYQDNADLQNAYGNLYSYYAILDPRGMCPSGWRVPTESDFLTLVSYIQPRSPLNLSSCLMLNHPSSPACSSSTHPYWNTNASYQADNHYGFSALASGRISGSTNSLFSSINTYAYFATQDTKYFRLYMGPGYNFSTSFMNSGEPVRCIKE